MTAFDHEGAVTMPDGLYAVSWGPDDRPVEASFEIRNGRPHRVAPILRRKFALHMKRARREGP